MKENDLILELKKIELKKFFDLNENLLKIGHYPAKCVN
jgi:hypothetical protein